jgi:hypothetical protein
MRGLELQGRAINLTERYGSPVYIMGKGSAGYAAASARHAHILCSVALIALPYKLRNFTWMRANYCVFPISVSRVRAIEV